MFHQAIAAVMLSEVVFIVASEANEQCKDGFINQQLCQKTCNFNHCSCTMTETTPFSSCTQKCNSLTSCPDMVCSGRNACSQKCFFGVCNMKCDSTKYCSQSCVWKAKCRKITCSSTFCNQVCSNCTMECPRGVDNCDQMCLGGECNMKCFAKHCRRQCFKGQCNYIGQAQSKGSVLQRRLGIWCAMTSVFIQLLHWRSLVG